MGHALIRDMLFVFRYFWFYSFFRVPLASLTALHFVVVIKLLKLYAVAVCKLCSAHHNIAAALRTCIFRHGADKIIFGFGHSVIISGFKQQADDTYNFASP